MKTVSRTLFGFAMVAGAALFAGGAYAETRRVPDQP
jgi:hypothetical protein